MNITILFFASLRERTGDTKKILILDDGKTVNDALQLLGNHYSKVRFRDEILSIAVNQAYITDKNYPLRDGDQVALLPPISGG